MAKKKTKYEKITQKYWRKHIGAEKADEVFLIEKETYPLNKKQWEDPKIAKVQLKSGLFVHFETDIADDSMGLDVETYVRLREQLSVKEIIDVFSVVNFITRGRDMRNLVDEDGFINWDHFIGSLIAASSKAEVYRRVLNFVDTRAFSNTTVSKDFNLSLNKVQDLLILVDNNLLPKEITNETSMDSLLATRREVWKTAKNIVPKSKFLLIANPKNFSKEFIQKVQSAYNERNITKLSDESQRYIGALLNNIGLNILHISDELILQGEGSLGIRSELPYIERYPKKLMLDIIEKSNSIQDISLNLVLIEKSGFKEEVFKKGSFIKRDLEMFNYIQRMIQPLSNENKDLVMNTIDFELWKVIHRTSRIHHISTSHILEATNLFNANKNNELNIPVISGKVGAYTYELLKKSDPRGLFLGYATDCCMTFGSGNGKSCIYAGYENPDSTFFIVRKGKDVYAQSWVWTSNGHISFDSFEALGSRSESFSSDIIECYKEAAKKFIEAGFKIVSVGSDGNFTPREIREAGIRSYANTPEELRMPFEGVYSDLNTTPEIDVQVVILAEKAKKGDK